MQSKQITLKISQEKKLTYKSINIRITPEFAAQNKLF